MKLSALLFLLPFAAAECPNACSGHGECSQFDSCDCYSGFQGGDCSERVCAYNWAWVTTANGDLNFDGDRYDGTVYSAEVRVAQTNEKLLTQAAPGGTWESWPYKQTQEEGHFYMECSNRGLCDRQTGECQCFDGFDGHACNRMVCPENCNGRGRCKTVTQLTNSAYKKWDRDMARECVCDPGFTGPTCAQRICPLGNDVLTQVNELSEVQIVDIFTTCEESGGASACTGDLANDPDLHTLTTTAGKARFQLSGSFALTYTDANGESYKTDQIAIDDFGTLNTVDGVSTTQKVAIDAQAALRALPNNVIGGDVVVTASSCYKVDENTFDFSVDTLGSAVSGVADWEDSDLYASSTDEGRIYQGDGQKVVVDTTTPASVNAASTGTDTATATTTLYRYQYPICLRLKVEFVGMHGALNDLVVDHSRVAYQGFTNDQHANAGVSSTVLSQIAFTSGKSDVSAKKPSEVTTGASAAQIGTNSNPKEITMEAATFTNTQGGAKTFYRDSRVEIKCEESGTDRSLGHYTIDTLTDTVLTVKETIVPSTCTAASSTITITQVSNVIATSGNADLTQGFAELSDASSNARVALDVSSTFTYFDSKVNAAKIKNEKILTADTATVAYIILDSEDASIIGTSVAPASGNIVFDGEGTQENNECGDRGLCDGETGECKCFAGYTGDACHIQKSISA